MNKSFIIILLSLCVAESFGQLQHTQYLYDEFDSTKYNNTLFLQSDLSFNSNGLNNRLIHKIFGGEYISETEKSEIIENLESSTRFGGDLINSLTYLYKTDSGNIIDGFQIGFSTGTHIDGITNDQFIGLALKGNKHYIDETITASHSNLLFINYQKLSLGFIKKMKRTGKFGVGVSLYNGQNFRLIDLNSFSMTTHTDGRSVDLDLEYESLRSDTSAGDFGQSSGLGFGLDLFVSEQISLFQGSTGGSFVAELRDFGYLFWNDKTISEKLDTTHLDFQGFEIEDIFSFEDSSNTNDVDSLFIVRKEGKNKIKTVLPGNLLIAVNQSFGNHQLGIRFSQRIVANHLAHVGLRYGYWIGERFQPYVNVGYGGYGKMNFGIGFTLDLGNFALYVNTTNLEGQILKDYSGGNSGYIGIKGRF